MSEILEVDDKVEDYSDLEEQDEKDDTDESPSQGVKTCLFLYVSFSNASPGNNNEDASTKDSEKQEQRRETSRQLAKVGLE